jgi:hypothetical protein
MVPEAKNSCAGEGQQQFTGLGWIQELRDNTQTHRELGDLVSLLCFQNKESRLIKKGTMAKV